jgi:hypothetical protein
VLQTSNPTADSAVNALVQTLLGRVQAILGDQFIGMYLDGSLASGAFDQASDIDFIVATAAEVSAADFARLQAMHEQVARLDSRWGDQLEGSYIGLQALRRYDPALSVHPNIERGAGERLKMAHHDAGWVLHRSIVRERGIVVAGPAPDTLIDPVAPADVRRAMLAMFPGWAARLLQNPANLAYPGSQAYVVLTLCRVRYTLETGAVAPKLVAARWAQAALGERWRGLIERAIAGRLDLELAVAPADVAQTLDLIRETLAYVEQYALGFAGG